jgi:hypothetical protein
MERSLPIVKQVDGIEQLKGLPQALVGRDALIDSEDRLCATLPRMDRVHYGPQMFQARLLRPGSEDPKAGSTVGTLGKSFSYPPVLVKRLK